MWLIITDLALSGWTDNDIKRNLPLRIGMDRRERTKRPKDLSLLMIAELVAIWEARKSLKRTKSAYKVMENEAPEPRL